MKILLDGLFLMCVGMGTVFLFLALLIAITEGIRRLCGSPAPPAPAGPQHPGEADEALRAAVITAAVTHHRARRQRPG